MSESIETHAFDEIREAIEKPEVANLAFMGRLRPYLPVVSPLLAVLGFIGGFIASGYKEIHADTEIREKDWRDALQRVSFDQQNLVSTGYLMESFSDDVRFRDSARQIERTVLEKMEDADGFDLLYSNMLSNLKTAEDVNTSLAIGRRLNQRLRKDWSDAKAITKISDTSFQAFLTHPAQFYSDAQTGKLREVMTLIWQLDSFSAGVACVASGDADQKCPHVSTDQLQLEHITLLNHKVATHSKKTVEVASSCSVQEDESDAGFSCDSPAASDN